MTDAGDMVVSKLDGAQEWHWDHPAASWLTLCGLSVWVDTGRKTALPQCPRCKRLGELEAAERERCLAIAKNAPRAGTDGRDLVVRTDIIRKIENPVKVQTPAPSAPVNPYDEPIVGGPHEVTNQYHSEPSRDPRQDKP